MRARLTTQTFSSVVFAAVALVIVTAVLASAFYALQAAGDIRNATGQLHEIGQADAKAEAARVKSRAQMAHQLDVLRQRSAEQLAQAKAQRRYLAQMSKVLRSHGIPVPSPPRVTVTASPKVRRAAPHRHPTSRATPTPTAPSPSPSALYCQLVPALCSGLPLGLPTPLP